MGKGNRKCEVCGIRESMHTGDNIKFSKFPLDPVRCKEWVKAVGNEELVHLPIEKLHSQRNVCTNHFHKNDYNKKGNRLKQDAIPTLNLTALPLTDIQLAGFPQHIYRHAKSQVPLPEAVPSTSQQSKNMEESENEFLPVPGPSSSQPISRCVLKELPLNERIHAKFQKKSDNSSKLKNIAEGILNLTPKEKMLMQQLEKTKCSLASLKRSAIQLEKLDSILLKEIVTSAISNQKRKSKGRRWTTKNKILALAIFKRSPKLYRYLLHLMPLPSTKTLQNVLKKIPVTTGINNAVIQHLKKLSSSRNVEDKYCGLVFDEIALKKRLLYDVTTDKVEGYQDFGAESERSSQLADHALVFMLQGIRAKFKQPVAFYFLKGTVSSHKLANIIKDIIITVEETGYKILTTICDQGPTNMGALKILRASTPQLNPAENYFYCNDKKIYIIFDVPHLFKSIRNNFHNYGKMSMCGKTAKWEHLLQVEEKNRNLLYLSKITKTHVQPKYRAKMKVKYAAQVLSTTVSAVLKLMSQMQNDSVVSDEMMQTGIIIHDLDRLFDKTNGPSCPADIKRGRRENVSIKTDHMEAWVEYRTKLETVVFQNSNGIKAKNVRCITGYITTLKSLHDIWTNLRSCGFKYLNLRQLNQDALENLFGVIRQHSPTNRNPTCYTFIAALKTALISGLTAPHNRGANCEKDFQKLLTDFHNEVFEDPKNKEELSSTNKEPKAPQHVACSKLAAESSNQDIPVLSIPDDFEMEVNFAKIEKQPIVYISGYIVSSILKQYSCKYCEECLKIENPDDDPIYNYIKLREWWPDQLSLRYPTKNLCQLVEEACKIFENEILPCLHYRNIAQLTITLFIANCDSSFLNCDEHKNTINHIIFNRLAQLLIRRQCQRINENIIMQEERIADINKKAQQQGTAK